MDVGSLWQPFHSRPVKGVRKSSTSVSLGPEQDLLEMPKVLVSVEICVCISFGVALSTNLGLSLSVPFITLAE